MSESDHEKAKQEFLDKCFSEPITETVLSDEQRILKGELRAKIRELLTKETK